jgi:hypothetical protein
MSTNEEFGRLVGTPEMDGPQVGSLGSIERVTWSNAICKSRSPAVAFFHVVFKGAALFVYLCQKLLGIQYVSVFVIVALLLAADFWVVKNLSGRLLVGLRWWNRIAEDGSNEWVYESAPNADALPALDRQIFWWPVYITPAIWATFAVLAFISFAWEYLPLHVVAAGLSGANTMGYMRCSSDARRRLQSSLAAGAVAGLGYVPGALPALGSGMLALLRQSGTAGATAPGRGAGGAAAQPTGISDRDAVADPFGARTAEI